MNRKDFQRNRTWEWIIKWVWGGCSQEQVDREKPGLFSLRAKINFESTHPVEEEVFLVALVAEMPRKGWIFWHVGQTVANRSSKLVTLSPYKLEVIHAGFYFNSRATKPAEMHGIKGSAQDSRAAGGCQGLWWHQELRLLLPVPGKERTGNCCCLGREGTQTTPNPAALWAFSTFVCVFS